MTAERAAHSLEHGWPTTRLGGRTSPASPNRQKCKPCVLLSPDKDLTAPVTATADT